MALPPIQFPQWAHVLFEPQWRYISARGGRGSGKTVSFARALILRMASSPIRVLCTREVQESIQESVYATLKAEISKMGLDHLFIVLSREIRSKAGGSFIFRGLNEITKDSMKSLADIDICWVEEAQSVSEASFETLFPTIRAPGSQIWFSWNPILETDPLYRMVVKEGLPDCANLFVNFDQNPWFPEVLRLEEQHMLGKDPIRHAHIWMGRALPAVAGAIYFNEIAQMESEGRIINMIRDTQLNTYIIMDLGYNDFTSCGMVQRSGGETRWIDFLENNRVSLEWFSNEFYNRGYEGAIIVMPHDGRAKALQTGRSPQEMMESYGWQVEICPNVGLEEGIRNVREQIDSWWIDKTRCPELIEHAKRYERNKNGHPVHNEHSHACDMIRYGAVYAPSMHNNRIGWVTGKLNYKQLTVR